MREKRKKKKEEEEEKKEEEEEGEGEEGEKEGEEEGRRKKKCWYHFLSKGKIQIGKTEICPSHKPSNLRSIIRTE